MRATVTNVVMAIVIGCIAGAARANDVSHSKADLSMALCQSVDRMAAGDTQQKAARLEAGLHMGEAAVAADASDARAHLAMCCNLGKQPDVTGLSLSAFGPLPRSQSAPGRA